MSVRSLNISLTSKQTRILYHILFWICLYILDVLIFGFGSEDFVQFLKLALAEVPPQILLAYTVMYWIIPRYVARKLFLDALFLIAIAFLVSGFIGHLLFISFSIYSDDISIWDLPKIFVRGFYAFLHASIAIAIKLVKIWYENEKRVSEMEKGKLESELKNAERSGESSFLVQYPKQSIWIDWKKSHSCPGICFRIVTHLTLHVT